MAHIMIGVEHPYSLLEKSAMPLSLLWCAEDAEISSWIVLHVISIVGPLRIMLIKIGDPNFRLGEWAMLLSHYDTTFIPGMQARAKP